MGQDRWCVVAVTNDEEWQTFVNTIGNPDWSKDPRFLTTAVRKQNEDELDRLIEGWIINHTAEDVAVLLQQAKVPAALVENAEDLFHDPQLKYRQAFVRLDHPEIGAYQISTAAFRSSRYSNRPRFPAPLLGEHNEYVLRELLDMSDDEITDLVIHEVLI
jgi:crotonobetainyl-CoA:carnitine CoA-transferase CaiB-like acyl-CoA transferase